MLNRAYSESSGVGTGMSGTVQIDASCREGGGQVVRTSMALAALCRRPLHLSNIRATRALPGLRLGHLVCARATATVCGGDLSGDTLGSRDLRFEPGETEAGEYVFSIGNAGSACLLFQTVLWPLLFAEGDSTLVLEGGTHTAFAPSYEFLERVFLPIVRRMGAKISLRLEKNGFMPTCEGRFVAEIEGGCSLRPLDLCVLSPVVSRRATALVTNLPGTIAIRELREVRNLLHWKNEECLPQVTQQGSSPGNVLLIEVVRATVSEMATVVGVRGISAEEVAEIGAKAMREYLDSGVPVGACLADQLIVPFALAGGGKFRTSTPSAHVVSNIEVAQRFLDVEIAVQDEANGTVIRLESRT